MPKPEHVAALAQLVTHALVASPTAPKAAEALYAAIVTDPAAQDAVLAALAEGGALHCDCAWCCTGTPREQRGQGHAGCPS